MEARRQLYRKERSRYVRRCMASGTVLGGSSGALLTMGAPPLSVAQVALTSAVGCGAVSAIGSRCLFDSQFGPEDDFVGEEVLEFENPPDVRGTPEHAAMVARLVQQVHNGLQARAIQQQPHRLPRHVLESATAFHPRQVRQAASGDSKEDD